MDTDGWTSSCRFSWKDPPCGLSGASGSWRREGVNEALRGMPWACLRTNAGGPRNTLLLDVELVRGQEKENVVLGQFSQSKNLSAIGSRDVGKLESNTVAVVQVTCEWSPLRREEVVRARNTRGVGGKRQR